MCRGSVAVFLTIPLGAGSLHSIIFHDAIQLALAGCKFSWAAQVLQCFSALDEPLPLVADAPIATDIDLLQELFLRDRLASVDSLPSGFQIGPVGWCQTLHISPLVWAAPKCSLPILLGVTNGKTPSCTGFSGFAWGLITSQLRRAAISTCLGPIVSATCAILMH